MSRPIVFGEIEGFPEGHRFEGRKEMMPNSFHRNWGAGIDGNEKEGTSAIVLSGGYEDDEDEGDQIIYTGAGGNDPNTNKQIENQSWKNRGNAGLLKSMNQGLPVRVIREFKHKSSFSPKKGYTYSGLYSVVDAWEEIGKSGFRICRFRLVYSGGEVKRMSPEQIELDYSIKEKRRKKGTVVRIVRDNKLSNSIKELYGNKCQICNKAIKTKHGIYSEGAHIRPLGKPHSGDDSITNILCLCPNHHVMLDKGGISISNEFKIIGAEIGSLNVESKHKINLENFSYHRMIHGYD